MVPCLPEFTCDGKAFKYKTKKEESVFPSFNNTNFKLESESPGGAVKMQIARPHPETLIQ